MSRNENKESRLGEVFKKLVSVTSMASFLTEDAIKNILNEVPLPKDIIIGLVQNAKNAKEELTQNVRQELRSYLQKIDPKELIRYVMANYDLEIDAKVSFKSKKDSAGPSKKSRPHNS